MAPAVMWFRRDLRLKDNPALLAASRQGPVLALFVLDPVLLKGAGQARLGFLFASLGCLDEDIRRRGGRLTVRYGLPWRVVPEVASEIGAASVHVSADFGPYGRKRDARVAQALAPVPLVATGSAYAVSPGVLLGPSGEPYRVYSAFAKAWRSHGWPRPAASERAAAQWLSLASDPLPGGTSLCKGLSLPQPGERAAIEVWDRFRKLGLSTYEQARDRLDLDATSRLSAYLKFGQIHPRTLLAGARQVAEGKGAKRFVSELAWREFYAHVLAHWPRSAWEPLRPDARAIGWHRDAKLFATWAEGRTGYPLVDAGMRQLRAEAWVHNRARMVVASFLVKDLHLDWRLGARHFMEHLVDGDLASNQHGWQWVAGIGTDAAPYNRIFNPVLQARRFDPEGNYVRRWVPELRGLPTEELFEPWKRAGGPPAGYPLPVVDHQTERQEALSMYRARAL
jgi:deoxyribodipyrimidine photo-lyase